MEALSKHQAQDEQPEQKRCKGVRTEQSSTERRCAIAESFS